MLRSRDERYEKTNGLTRPVSIIGIASIAGAEAPGQEKAPSALRDAGLLLGLREPGLPLDDAPDTQVWRWP